jgi:hypothetical protein
MKRLLLVGGIFALVFTARGGSHKAEPQVSTGTTVPHVLTAVESVRTVRVIVSRRKRETGREAERLLRRVVLPRGARRISQRTGNGLVSSPNLGVNIFTQYEYRHAFWRVPESRHSVVAFLKRHAPPGFRLTYVGNAATYPYRGVEFDSWSVGGRISNRLLVSLVPHQGSTTVRVDAGVVWTYPRSPREVVPAAVREIDIRSLRLQSALRRAGARKVSRRVTDPRKVARIIRWFDALNVVQPNTYVVGCQLVLSVPVRFVFRSAPGATLASAIAPSVPASTCEQIQFTIRGQPQPSLVDSTPEQGMAFIDRVQRLLRVRFGPRNSRF